MKKISSVLFALTLASVVATSSSAAFVSKGKTPVTAVVTMGGSQVVSFSLKIRDHVSVNGPDRTQVAWAGNIDPTALGANTWRIADQVVIASTTITDQAGGIQLITDNTNAAAVPQYVGSTTTEPSGLLLVPKTGNTTIQTPLPLAWSIKASSQVVGSEIVATDPNSGVPASFQWLFVKDKKSPSFVDAKGATQPAFTDGTLYSTIINANGIHFGQADTEIGGGAGVKTSYVYFQSNFAGALGGNSYKTNQLTFEAFTQ